MPSKILLFSVNRYAVPDAVFPLGLAYLNAALRRAGHQCVWLDRLVDLDRFETVLEEFQPDFVGISLRNIDDVLIRQKEVFFDELAALTAAIRRRVRSPIILGGSGFSIFPERLLELAGADFGIAGEGEHALVALIEALETGSSYDAIPGLVYRTQAGIQVNPASPEPMDQPLASEDRPERLSRFYLDTSAVLNLQSQRGCGFRCCYCTYPLIEGRQHRRRPAELVADDFEQLQRQGAKYAFIVDSVFNSTPAHVREICEALLRRRIKMSWGCFLRPQGLTQELMALMTRAGLAHIEFGTDSLSDSVLAAYQKGFTFEDVLQASALARQARAGYCHFLICGGPGETEATLQEAFENSKRLEDPVIMAVVGMRIYPGTSLYERALAEGCITRQTDLLTPTYYVAPGLTADRVFARLAEYARQSPSWIAGDPLEGYQSLIARLRKRGVIGPLWSYVSLAQRLWPQATAPKPSA